MTPDQIREARQTDWQAMNLGNKKVDELCDEIERVQHCNEMYSGRHAIIVERLMLERDKARAELAALKTPHACGDCENHWIKIDSQESCMAGLNLTDNIWRTWLCGHFKAKGNQ